MKTKGIFGRLAKMSLAVFVPVLLSSCESIWDDRDDCEMYIEFVYDHNMEYADTFGRQVGDVDIYVFDADDKFLFTRHSRQEYLKHGNRMHIGEELDAGRYSVLTFGGLSQSFLVSDADGNAPTAGKTTLGEMRVSLVRSSDVVSGEFPPLWVGKAVGFDYKPGRSALRVHLIKDTNRFNLLLAEMNGDSAVAGGGPDYTFEIVTPEGAVYGAGNAPLAREALTYKPYSLEPGSEPGERARASVNTARLLYGEGLSYRLVVRNVQTGTPLLDYDLMKLLRYIKPDSRPDGSALPMQEFLDRQSEWHIVVLYKKSGGGGWLAVAIMVNDWIVWLDDVGV